MFAHQQSAAKPRPRVIVVGVNVMELDIIRPLLLLLKRQMPNLSKVIENGAYGKLRTVSARNCPRVQHAVYEHESGGARGFKVGGITANTKMLKEEPVWLMQSKSGSPWGWPTSRLLSRSCP
jgi:predicted AlkP superfamily phosphohydrolase/phosphomutase